MSRNMEAVRNDVKALLDGDEPSEYYRIRKTWEDSKSQIGAYTDLESAKKNCPDDYFVFDNDGKVVFDGDENMTQEKFNELMTNWVAEQATKEPSSWSAPAREWAEKHGVVAGDANGNKQYKKFATKEEIVTMLKAASAIKTVKVRPIKRLLSKNDE